MLAGSSTSYRRRARLFNAVGRARIVDDILGMKALPHRSLWAKHRAAPTGIVPRPSSLKGYFTDPRDGEGGRIHLPDVRLGLASRMEHPIGETCLKSGWDRRLVRRMGARRTHPLDTPYTLRAKRLVPRGRPYVSPRHRPGKIASSLLPPIEGAGVCHTIR